MAARESNYYSQFDNFKEGIHITIRLDHEYACIEARVQFPAYFFRQVALRGKCKLRIPEVNFRPLPISHN